MTGAGAGPSRRSHTKSRKGCKTCKRRHIRCDETFPQCRNCTKHQVRCDYMEALGSDTESMHSPEETLRLSPISENSVDHWQQTGLFPFPGLSVFPQPRIDAYSRNEIRLLHHLATVSSDMMMKGATNFTLWTDKIPKFLSVASTYPYVMQALLSFSANHLAWTSNSPELRNLHIQHGTAALSELHKAIGNFSHENADAVLAASLLLLWQATDWQSWSSLRAGIQAILSVMQTSKQASVFAEYINDEELLAGSYRLHRRSLSLDSTGRQGILDDTIHALQHLQAGMMLSSELDAYWIGQLLDYVQRLSAAAPAQTPDDQFGHLYILRKWAFWAPVSLLEKQGGQAPSLLVLAHLYATALALEPLFPDLGSSFCARIALSPLEAIISVTDAMQSKQGWDQATSMELAALMHFPRQTALNFRARSAQPPNMGIAQQPTIMRVDPETLSYTSFGNLSPAFAPSPLHFSPGHASTSSSSYLEVPASQAGFTYGTQSWGAAPSPGFPPQMYTNPDDQGFDYGDTPTLGAFRGGFVAPVPIWT